MNPFENIQYVKNDIKALPWKGDLIPPVENPRSECFECEAGMCSWNVCPGDQYQWIKDDLNDAYYLQDINK